MSHEAASAALRALLRRELFEIHPLDHRGHIRNESDRTSIILSAAMNERHLVERLSECLAGANSDEKNRLFAFEGPLGSFSNRIRMAQALEIIDRQTRRYLDLIREMRNAAAHAHPSLTFATPEIRSAVEHLFQPPLREVVAGWQPGRVRRAFEIFCANLNTQIMREQGVMSPRDILDAVERLYLDDGSPHPSLDQWHQFPETE